MKCLHWPGMTGHFLRKPWLATLLIGLGLALAGSPAAHATPAPTQHSSSSKKPAATKASARKAGHSQPVSKSSAQSGRKTSGKANGKVNAKAKGKANARTGAIKACSPAAKGKSSSKTQRGNKRRVTANCSSTASQAAAVATPEVLSAAAASPEGPTAGLQLPLMLRTTPSLPDNPAALQSRLDSLVAHQGTSAAGAEVSGVRQLAPDIYAFSLRCADAEQCQRLRMAIEAERDWVAGLQLDERRNIPKPPERHAPSAR